MASSPALGQVGTAVSIFSDARFRGYSLSDEHPAAFLDLSYDDPSGVYGAISASAFAYDEAAVRPLGLQINGGYVRRVSSGTTVDVGVVHSRYSRYSTRGTSESYTEIYGGLTHKFITSRLYASPHYFDAGVWTLYGELDANVSPARKLRLHGHVGMLVPIRDTRTRRLETGYDWRLGISREVGPASVHGTWSGGTGARSRGTLTFGVSWPF